MVKRNRYAAPTKEAIAKVKRIFADKIREVHTLEPLLKTKDLQGTPEPDSEVCRNLREARNPRFRYKMSRYCRYVTLTMFLIIAAIAFILLFTSSGTYLSAWFSSIAAAALLLFIISFPRYLSITDDNLEVHCILEMTEIPLRDILRIQPINRYRLKRHIPVLGSYGFGGFFGYYADLIHLRIVRVFATRLDNLVMIQDIYDQRYIVNCDYRDLFIELLRQRVEQARAVMPVFEEESDELESEEESEENGTAE